MERLTYVAENGEVLFHPADLPDMRESMRMISSGMKMKISLSNGQMIH